MRLPCFLHFKLNVTGEMRNHYHMRNTCRMPASKVHEQSALQPGASTAELAGPCLPAQQQQQPGLLNQCCCLLRPTMHWSTVDVAIMVIQMVP